ncbi:MAG: DUF6036 family nucleotidyltransferase [Pyrinomonadaceae bacterium]
MIEDTIHEPWRSFLRKLDKIVDEVTQLHCMGGFVVTQIYGYDRKTRDIDVLSIMPKNVALIDNAGKGSLLHKECGIYLDKVGVATVPENYEDRLIEIYSDKFELLRLLAFDPYDIALAKIERNIDRDRDDVRFLARTIPFDLSVLKQRYYDELRPYLAIPEREDLTLRLWIEMIEEER